MDDYHNSNSNSNNDPSEGDSPGKLSMKSMFPTHVLKIHCADSGSGSHRRHDLLSDSGLFQVNHHTTPKPQQTLIWLYYREAIKSKDEKNKTEPRKELSESVKSDTLKNFKSKSKKWKRSTTMSFFASLKKTTL